MWGKVQNYAHRAHRTFKSGLAHAHHMYNKGMHIAGDLSGIYDVAKNVSRHLADYGDHKMGGSTLTSAHHAGVSWGDAVQSKARNTHADVIKEIDGIGNLYSRLHSEVSKGYSTEYTGG